MAGLTNLTHLSLYLISVTDAGLRHLSTLKNLIHLNLDYCDTSEAAEEELHRQTPGLHIVHDHEALESDEDSEGKLAD